MHTADFLQLQLIFTASFSVFLGWDNGNKINAFSLLWVVFQALRSHL